MLLEISKMYSKRFQKQRRLKFFLKMQLNLAIKKVLKQLKEY